MRPDVLNSRISRSLVFSVALAVSFACAKEADRDSKSSTASAADSQAAHVAEVVAAGGTVDSILPIAEHLRRFRATTATPRDTLVGASRSLRHLAERWALAVERRDTAALNAMVLDRAEFAWLYYPDAAISKPPYEAPPELLWGQILASSEEGIQRVLARFGGKQVQIATIDCGAAVQTEGRNRIRSACDVALVVDGVATPPGRYFGSIIERDGRFKLIGFSNRL